MGWRGDWPAYQPRPKPARLPSGEFERLHDAARRFVARSPVLRELVVEVTLARGRLYFWRGEADVVARVPPLSAELHLLETPHGRGWSAYHRGAPRATLRALERDRHGSLHGLGALVSKAARDQQGAQVRLHREFGVPLRVVAEPRDWYAFHRTPAIAEARPDRVLVRFEALGPFGGFGGTCLYARVDDVWACYVIKPSAAATIGSAEAWLRGRDWQPWA